MAATMSSEMRKAERIIQLIDECKAMGLEIKPPSINQPRAEFGVDDQGAILFGLGAVKGVGAAAIELIMQASAQLGRPFADLFDLCEHLDLQKVNRKVLEGLIHAGAMDCLPGDRATLVANLERAMAFGQKCVRDREGGQASLFGTAAAVVSLRPTLQPAEPYDPLVQLSLERRALGFFLSGHPFAEYEEVLDGLPVATVREAAGRGEGAWVDLAGVVTSFRNARDKHKRLYARLHFEDRSGLLEVVVYARLYAETADLVAGDAILVVGGRIQVRSDGTREVVAERLTPIDDVLGAWTREVLLEVDLAAMGARGLDRLGELLAAHGRLEEPNEVSFGEAAAAAAASGAAGPVLAGRTPAAPAGAAPVVIDAWRGDEHWLLQSGWRISLTLASLRALRDVAGLRKLELDVRLPAPLRRGGWNGQRA
jgi:DNA polymerase III subunit alpha